MATINLRMCQKQRQASDHYYRLSLLVSDLTALVAAYASALLLRFNPDFGEPLFTAINTFLGLRETGALDGDFITFYIDSAGRILAWLGLSLVGLYAFSDLYEGRRFLRPRPIAWLMIRGNLIALLLFFGYFYLRRNVYHPRSIFLLILTLNVCYGVWFRALINRLLDAVRRIGRIPPCPVVLVGATREADFIGRYLETFRPHDLKLATRLPLKTDGDSAAFHAAVRQACRDTAAEILIVADPAISVNRIMELLAWTADERIAVKILSDRMNVLVHPGRLPVDYFCEKPLVHFAPPRHPWRIAWDHLWSTAAAAVALIPAAPLMALIAGLIRLTSRGPALFVQYRIGTKSRPSTIFKLQTMYNQTAETQDDSE